MSTELREAYRTAATDVPVLGDVEAAVGAGRRRRRAARVGGPLAVAAVVAAVALVVPGLFAGASGPKDPVATEGAEPVEADDLVGRSFVSSGPLPGLPDEFRPFVRFDPQSLRASGACSIVLGKWSLDGSILVVTDPSVAAPYCPNDPGPETNALLEQLLTAEPTLELDGAELTVTTDDMTVTLREINGVRQDVTLDGPTWRLVEYAVTSGSDGAGASVPAKITSTLRFEGDKAFIEYACNGGSARALVTGATVELTQMLITEKACAGAALTVEEAVQRVLFSGDRLSYAVDSNTLTLTGEAGELVYRIAPSQ